MSSLQVNATPCSASSTLEERPKSITTDAWVLYAGESARAEGAQLTRQPFTFSELTAGEVLVEPIYGCWEANMSHALRRQPVDICRQRKEEPLIIGNSGVVRVLRPGPEVTAVRPGDLCLLDANVTKDRHGYTLKVLGYDAPGTMGLLAKQTKVPEQCLLPLPKDSAFSAKEWAAFSVRYLTAWDNWQVAWACWRAQMPDVAPQDVFVWGWGGGVSLAQLALARHAGCQTAMICSSEPRSELIQRMGILPIARSQFADLSFDEKRYKDDPDYRSRYLAAERIFLQTVQQHTRGEGVSIFIDNIGAPVFRATLKALGRQGVVTTSGWKHGMQLSVLRGIECINRHIHVHTHGSRDKEARRAMKEAEVMNWRPPVADERVYDWQDLPQLALDYEEGRIESYFPIFEVNPL